MACNLAAAHMNFSEAAPLQQSLGKTLIHAGLKVRFISLSTIISRLSQAILTLCLFLLPPQSSPFDREVMCLDMLCGSHHLAVHGKACNVDYKPSNMVVASTGAS